MPNLTLPAALTCYVCGAVSIVVAVLRAFLPLSKLWRRVAIGLVVFLFIVSLLCWADAGLTTAVNVVNLLQGTFAGSIPIMLGALTGVICSRSGVINVAIEGQLLLGAFTAAIVASGTGSLWLGLISGALAGSLVGLLLAVFAIAYRVDQVVLGVVINTLILGLTGYLYDDLMIPYQNTLNSPATFSAIKIPLLGDIPIIGPVFFDSTIFLYLTYLALASVQVGLFSTKWGLRTRAIGEHPVAADTVGIPVIAMRYRNVIAAGIIAGIGGAYFTIGSVGSFGKDMTSGEGYIALAAMIFGRYTPFGAVAAALLFGFTTQLQSILSTLNTPIQSNLLLMTPVHRHDHRAGRARRQGPRSPGRGHPLRQGLKIHAERPGVHVPPKSSSLSRARSAGAQLRRAAALVSPSGQVPVHAGDTALAGYAFRRDQPDREHDCARQGAPVHRRRAATASMTNLITCCRRSPPALLPSPRYGGRRRRSGADRHLISLSPRSPARCGPEISILAERRRFRSCGRAGPVAGFSPLPVTTPVQPMLVQVIPT